MSHAWVNIQSCTCSVPLNFTICMTAQRAPERERERERETVSRKLPLHPRERERERVLIIIISDVTSAVLHVLV